MKRMAVSFLISLLAPGFWWLTGFDFDQRGYAAASCFLAYLLLFISTYAYPKWDKEK
jgi:hypothetical protein